VSNAEAYFRVCHRSLMYVQVVFDLVKHRSTAVSAKCFFRRYSLGGQVCHDLQH